MLTTRRLGIAELEQKMLMKIVIRSKKILNTLLINIFPSINSTDLASLCNLPRTTAIDLIPLVGYKLLSTPQKALRADVASDVLTIDETNSLEA